MVTYHVREKGMVKKDFFFRTFFLILTSFFVWILKFFRHGQNKCKVSESMKSEFGLLGAILFAIGGAIVLADFSSIFAMSNYFCSLTFPMFIGYAIGFSVNWPRSFVNSTKWKI